MNQMVTIMVTIKQNSRAKTQNIKKEKMQGKKSQKTSKLNNRQKHKEKATMEIQGNQKTKDKVAVVYIDNHPKYKRIELTSQKSQSIQMN